jgi:hypothetical protein
VTTVILLTAGCFLCAWATLRCVGNECERRLRSLEDQIRAERDAATASATAAATTPPLVSGGFTAARPPAAPAAGKGRAAQPAGKPAGRH